MLAAESVRRVIPIVGNGAPGLRVARAASRDERLDPIERFGTRLHLYRGQTIFNEGDPVISLYRVVSGAARLCKHRAGGRRQIADFAFPGEYFGFIRTPERMWAAEAACTAIIVSYPLSTVERLGEELLAVRTLLLASITERSLRVENQLVILGRQTAMERVASFILDTLKRKKSGERSVVDLPMSRLDIADYLGLTFETVSRALTELNHAHIIALDGPRHAAVRNLNALRAMAAA